MFILKLFTIVKIWKQHKCLPTGECIKKMWYTHTHTHTGIILSHKKEWKFVICSNMDGFGGYYAKWDTSKG